MNVIVAGDFCPDSTRCRLTDSGFLDEAFFSASMAVKGADYSLVNLECPIVWNPLGPIKKSGPALKCDLSAVDALKYIGFKCVTLANNHIADYSSEGVMDTIRVLEQSGIDVIGAGENAEAASKFIVKYINGERLAVINCCESEFSVATATTAGANPMLPIRQYYDIQQARRVADYVMVVVHGGHEFYPFPSLRMKETYRFFIDAGADAVVNHHQHCCSGYECYQGKPIVYGVGNFYFDRECGNSNWNIGFLASLSFSPTDVSFEPLPYSQCADKPVVRMLSGSERSDFEKLLKQRNSVIENDDELQTLWNEYAESRVSMLQDAFSPYATPIPISLAKRGFLPRFLQPARLKEALNRIRCESHRDTLIYLLQKFSEK